MANKAWAFILRMAVVASALCAFLVVCALFEGQLALLFALPLLGACLWMADRLYRAVRRRERQAQKAQRAMGGAWPPSPAQACPPAARPRKAAPARPKENQHRRAA